MARPFVGLTARAVIGTALACYAFFAASWSQPTLRPFGGSSALAAPAAHRRVAVLRVDYLGDMPANNKDFLSERLVIGLAAAEFQVFAGLTVTQMLKQGSRLEACRQPNCYQEIAQRLGVEYLVTGIVQVDRKNYEVTLDLVAGRDGKSVGQSRERCELCGIKEVGSQMDRQVLALRGYAEQAAAVAPARFSIESRPAGAEVTIDGKPSGVTPLAADVGAGSHQITVRASGYKPSERNVYVESGMNGYLSVDLSPDGLPFMGGGGGGSSKVWAVTAMVIGAVAVGVGYFVSTLDGDFVGCLDPPGDIKANCRVQKQRETSLEAGILMGAGGMLVVGGGAMLFVSPSSGPESAATSNGPSRPSGFVAGVRGRF
jgi:TolB-like protein